MNTIHPKFYFLILVLFSNLSLGKVKDVGAIVGAINKSLAGGSASAPKYTVASAAVSGEPVYSGQILNVGSNYITFETTSDESENTVSPFTDGVFLKAVKSPVLTATLSENAIGGITVDYAGSGFTTAPEIIIDYPDSGDDVAEANCTLNSGGLNTPTLGNAGSGYDTEPKVTVVGGPHLVKLTESGDSNEGRFFRIIDNNETALTLDISTLAAGESLSNVLQVDYSIEVVPAPTIATVMGRTADELPTNFNESNSNGSTDGADFIYVFQRTSYTSFCFMPAGGGNPAGWYAPNLMRFGLANDYVLYPDDGFIIAKRTPNELTIDFAGGSQTKNQKMRLPKSGRSACMSNPFGADMLLAEIITPNLIGTGANKFNPGASETDSTMDVVYFLSGDGNTWPQYYHASGVNVGISKIATANANLPSPSNSGRAINLGTDISMVNGAISTVLSCSATGSTNSLDHNITEHTLITLHSGVAPKVGFNVELSGFFGRKLDGLGDGTHEVDINGTQVSQGSGIFFRSKLNGTHKIVHRPGNSSFVIKQKRDIRFIKGNKGPGAKWSTGQGGAGYDEANATAEVFPRAYFIGGGCSTMAVARCLVNSSGVITGFSFNNASHNSDNDITSGAGYNYSPQVVITSGGWRLVNSGGNHICQDAKMLGATDGFIVVRKGTNRTLTYFKPRNPFN